MHHTGPDPSSSGPANDPAAFGSFVLPTEVRFGSGVAMELVSALAPYGDRLLVVTDLGVRLTGLVDQILAPVIAAGVSVTVYDDVSPNPRDHECRTAADLARSEGATAIVAIGGGSPIDAAKCAAALVTNGGSARDWAVPRRLGADPLPLIAIPTTAGTGSEVTRGAVITDVAHRTKLTVKDSRMAPRLALVDPSLTLSVPPGVTAATGMDVLTHAIEAYTGRKATPVSDALALHAIRLVAENLVRAYEHGDDAGAREGMMMASLLAGMALGNAEVAAVHCLAEALGGRYDTPHGVANAVMLPPVMRYNIVTAPDRHADIATALGIDTRDLTADVAADRAVDAVAALAHRLEIPRLTELDRVTAADFGALALTAAANSSTPSNARPIDAAGYEAILTETWGGRTDGVIWRV